jgi:hypothetical protein
MAWINCDNIVLENDCELYFDDIFPVKILYPMVLMSNSTVYNISCNNFV